MHLRVFWDQITNIIPVRYCNKAVMWEMNPESREKKEKIIDTF